jgi:hypothetical protein
MRFVLKLFAVVLGVLGLWAGAAARAQETGGRVVLVLPFENRSGNPSLELDRGLVSRHAGQAADFSRVSDALAG